MNTIASPAQAMSSRRSRLKSEAGSTSLGEAISQAAKAADESRLPQLVFRSPATSGWVNLPTGSRSTIGAGVEVNRTVLPVSYFA